MLTKLWASTPDSVWSMRGCVLSIRCVLSSLPVCDVSTHNCLAEELVQLSRLVARPLHCWTLLVWVHSESVAHGLYWHGLYAALYVVIANRLASSVTVIATSCVIFTRHLMNEKLTLLTIWFLTSSHCLFAAFDMQWLYRKLFVLLMLCLFDEVFYLCRVFSSSTSSTELWCILQVESIQYYVVQFSH